MSFDTRGFYEDQRFGSARWADGRDVAGLLGQPSGAFLGYWKNRPLRLASDAPILTVAGAGAGKGRDVLMYNACTYPGSMLAYDPKGELAAVSAAAQVRMRKHVWRIDPIHGGDRCDPLDILELASPTLHADAMLVAEMLCPLSGGANSQFFELRAREWLAAFLIADVEEFGKTGLPRLYRIVNAIEGDPDGFINFAKVMAGNASDAVRRTAHELLTLQKEAPKEFGGIVSELYKYLAFLNEPNLLRSLEEPDFSLYVLSDPEQRCNVYLNVPPEYIGIWNPYLRLCFGVSMLYKQRRPDAPGVLFLIDEAGQMGRFEMLQRAFTFGRGMGVRAWAVFQDLGQIVQHYQHAGVQTFLGSAQVRQFFGVRDYETAQLVSNMLGDQTLSYIDPAAREHAVHAQQSAMRGLLRGTDDPLDALREAGHQARLAQTPSKQHRRLLTPEEVLGAPENRQILFISGTNCPPIAAWRHPYYERREMAGLFLPNPYHPPVDRVRLPGRFVRRWASVKTAPVPAKFADFPQYADGRPFQYVDGFRP